MPSFLKCRACGELVTEKRNRGYHLACRVRKLIRYRHVCPGCGRVTERHRRPDEAEIRTCMNCRPSYVGANNPNWRGGVKTLATQLRDSPQMRAWRTAVFQRDKFTCVLCGQVGGKLNADHVWPFAFIPQLALEVWNGRTLCVACHEKTPTYRTRATRYFRELMPDPEDRAAFFLGRNLIYAALLNGDPLP